MFSLSVRVSSTSVICLGVSNEHYLNNRESPEEISTKGLVNVWTSVRLCNKYDAQEVIVFLGSEGKKRTINN